LKLSQFGVLCTLAFSFLGVSAAAFGDIRTTAHAQFRGDALKNTSKDASDICIFCHTPFTSGTQAQVAPLWQNAAGSGHIYTLYDDIGRLQYGDKPAVGSQSIACLSCHDSNQALQATHSASDHPYGVPYRGFLKNRAGKAAIAAQSTEDGEGVIKAKHLAALDDFNEARQGMVDNRTVWWVSSTGNVGPRTRGDLPLYARRDESNQDIPHIECTSCHNPHSNNPLFLRVGNKGSTLCFTCHAK
jgi:predicted CXXCH cytochrome family protein